MRVIQVVPAISEEASGPSYSVVRLCESLIDQGAEVTLAALDWAPIKNQPSFLKTFPLGFGPRRLGISPAMRHWLNVKACSETIDIIHNHGMWQMNAIYPGWAASKSKLNLVVSPRGAFSEWAMQSGSIMKKVFWPLLQQPALKNTTCFHATAVSEYEDIRRLGFRQPVTIIPNGIDIPKLSSHQPNPVRSLLFLGRIHPKKGLNILLPAWRAIQGRYPSWRLIIAGSDDGHYGKSGYLEEIYLLVKKLGIERIEFVGAVYGKDKTQAYMNANLFILPTYSENFGMTVAEALAASTPAIVTNGAPWEGLDKNGAGWWIDIGIEPLIACLENALSRSPEELEQMGAKGREWMINDFSWLKIGAQMTSTYQWLLNKSLAVPNCVRVD